jgi:quinol monooxygenase YgiN
VCLNAVGAFAANKNASGCNNKEETERGGAPMIVLQVTIQVKPEHVAEFLEVVRYDAEHSEKDEPGCLRFDVIQDRADANRFYFYEVYKDDAALAVHRETPHFKFYAEKTQPWLAGTPERRFGKNLIPSDKDWR